MNKFIVITTINNKSEAIKKYDNLKDWNLIVIGDSKTPNINLKNGIYLNLKNQKQLNFSCIKKIPYNTYSRINIGYLLALKNKADIIASVDDDNIPLSNWGKNVFVNSKTDSNFIFSKNKFIDILFHHKYVSKKNIWHRGFPLEDLNLRKYQKSIFKQKKHIEVQAGLWNVEPDVDAVCRISNGPYNLKFKDKKFIIDNKAYSPFNTQNTIFSKRIIPGMCLMFGVGRMLDIFSSFVCQRIMRELGSYTLFTGPTVKQIRNEHNLKNDLIDEITGIKNFKLFTRTLDQTKLKKKDNVPEMFAKISKSISELEFISKDNIKYQSHWIDDTSKFF